MKCTNSKCTIKAIEYIVSKENAIGSEFYDDSRNRRVLLYFKDFAPCQSSYTGSVLSQEVHQEVLDDMLQSWKDHYLFVAYDTDLKRTEETYEKYNLKGDRLCSRCKRFVCKRDNKAKQETDLSCLLRHIRNAIAHNRVFSIHGGNYVSFLFIDVNKAGNVNAKVICNRVDLEKWKRILEKAVAEERERMSESESS